MKRKVLFLLPFLLCLKVATFAQNEMFKALFMYNFTKNVEWPADMRQGDFVIYVFGDTPILGELEKVAAGKKVGQQDIVIKKVDNIESSDKCHILYIPNGQSDKFSAILPKVDGKPVLLITDKDGMAQQGACINYVTVGGKLNFEINKARFQKQKLQMSGSLSKLGIVI